MFNAFRVSCLALMFAGCAPSTQAVRTPVDIEAAEPTDPAQQAPESSSSDGEATDGVTSDSSVPAQTDTSQVLQVGSVTDGATLKGAEVLALGPSSMPGETQVSGAVLTLSFDGSGEPPVTTARLKDDGLGVVIVIGGVRGVTASVPLTSGEGGRTLAEAKIIDLGPVHTIARTFYGDDAGVQIEITLQATVTLELRVGEKGRSVELLMRSVPILDHQN